MTRTQTPSDRDEIIVSRPILTNPRVVHTTSYTGTCNVQEDFLAPSAEPLHGSSPDVYDLLGNTWVNVSGCFVRGSTFDGYWASHTGSSTLAMAMIDCFDDWRNGVCGGCYGSFTFGTGSLAGTQRDVGFVLRRSDEDYILAYGRMEPAEGEITFHIEVHEGGAIIQSVSSATMAMYGMGATNVWINISGRDIVLHGGPDSDSGMILERVRLDTEKHRENTQYGLYFRGDVPSPDVRWINMRVFGATREYRTPA